MAEREAKSTEWTAAWIEQQRELLRQQAKPAAVDAGNGPAEPKMADAARELSEKWQSLGKSYLSGLAPYAQQPGGAEKTGESTPLKMGEELLHVWRNAWTTAGDIGQGAVSNMSDLLARLPPIGLAREHTEAWRELVATQAECQRLEQELRVVLLGVQGDALTLLEQRVREREQKGELLPSYRDLYDLWVECAEQVYAKVAHSEAYCKLQAQLGNASMRLRSHQQGVIEHGLKQFDLPTRSEINTVHRQLREQKQQLREQKDKISALEQQLRQSTASKSAQASPRSAARQPARRKAATRKPPRGKTVRAKKTGKSR